MGVDKKRESRGLSDVRLGLYVDTVYCVVEVDGIFTVAAHPVDFGFLLFACEVGLEFDSLVLFGRSRASLPNTRAGVLPIDVKLVEFPDYDDLSRFLQVIRSARGTLAAFWKGLGGVDVVWLFGPHPFSLMFALAALLRRKAIVLGVRQDSLHYFEARLRSRRMLPALLAVPVLDLLYRSLARRVKVTAVGSGVAQRYGAPRSSVLDMTVSLVRRKDVAETPPVRDYSGTIELLTVGRVEPEKNPLLLVEAVARLEQERPGWAHLTWVGSGRLENPVRQRIVEQGLQECIDLRGYVPFGPELLEFYRHAHAFVHVGLTEGVPQVLIEALACGTPVVATDVGGVRGVLDGGKAGLLVPPADIDALTRALKNVIDDESLRHIIVARGLQIALTLTLEAQAARVARFISSEA